MGCTGSKAACAEGISGRSYHDMKAVAPRKQKMLKFHLGDLLKPDHMSHLRHKSVLSRDAMSLDEVAKLPFGTITPKSTPMAPPHSFVATFSSNKSKTVVDALLFPESSVSYSTKVKLVGKVNENTTIKVKGKTYMIKAEYEMEAAGMPFEQVEERAREESDFKYLLDPMITKTRSVSLYRDGVEQSVASYKYNPDTGACKLAYSN